MKKEDLLRQLELSDNGRLYRGSLNLNQKKFISYGDVFMVAVLVMLVMAIVASLVR